MAEKRPICLYGGDIQELASGDTLPGGASNNWLTANNATDFAIAPIGTGENSITLGNNASTSTVSNAIAIGTNSSAASSAIALGYGSNASTTNCISIGISTYATSSGVTIGNNSTGATSCTVLGAAITSTGGWSVTIGHNSSSSGTSSVAVGNNSVMNATFGVAIGNGATVNTGSSDAIAIGKTATIGTSALYAIAIGDNASVGNGASNSIVIGTSTTTPGDSSVIIGHNSAGSTFNQTVIGPALTSTDVVADVAYSLKIGCGTVGQHNFIHLHTKGHLEIIGDEAQFVMPNYATASIPATTVEGGSIWDSTTKELKIYNGTAWAAIGAGGGASTNWIDANNSTDFGTAPAGTGTNAIAIGFNARTWSATDAVAIGTASETSGSSSIAIGVNTNALGGDAVAIGNASNAGAFGSVVIGAAATTAGSSAVVIGRGSSAIGNTTVALGYNATTTSTNGVSIGASASASANSTAIGLGCKATLTSQTSVGTGILTTSADTNTNYSAKFGYGGATADKNMLNLYDKGKLELYGDEAQFVLPTYTVATVPTGVSAGMIFVSDETGGSIPAFHDGTNWRRVTDRAIVS